MLKKLRRILAANKHCVPYIKKIYFYGSWLGWVGLPTFFGILGYIADGKPDEGIWIAVTFMIYTQGWSLLLYTGLLDLFGEGEWCWEGCDDDDDWSRPSVNKRLDNIEYFLGYYRH